MGNEEILSDPTVMLRRDVQHEMLAAFEMGRLAMALEVQTRIRFLEGVGGEALLLGTREEMVSMLQTFLRDQGLDDLSAEWYERMLEDRKLKFIAEGDVPDGAPSS